MKILSSEIQYASRSTLSMIGEETTCILDENGNLISVNQAVTQNQSKQKTASAEYTTPADVVEIGDEAKARSSILTEANTTLRHSIDKNIEKSNTLASMLRGAADILQSPPDDLRERINARLKADLSQKKDETSPFTYVVYDPLTQEQTSLYRSIASQLRSKADTEWPTDTILTPGNTRVTIGATTVSQTTLVQASGIVRTADGKEIDLSLNMGMVWEETGSMSVESFCLTDPLVINFSGTSAELSEEKILFDLDGDGEEEQVSRLKSGSGFLALDLNKDGKINDGSELFGPSTGNGFPELSFYDEDNNQWIDENDAIYQDLMVWIQDSSGKDVLKQLSETGIGAIHLGSVDSEFLIKALSGEVLGKITSTGMALTEDGAVRSVQQVDLRV